MEGGQSLLHGGEGGVTRSHLGSPLSPGSGDGSLLFRWEGGDTTVSQVYTLLFVRKDGENQSLNNHLRISLGAEGGRGSSLLLGGRVHNCL